MLNSINLEKAFKIGRRVWIDENMINQRTRAQNCSNLIAGATLNPAFKVEARFLCLVNEDEVPLKGLAQF